MRHAICIFQQFSQIVVGLFLFCTCGSEPSTRVLLGDKPEKSLEEKPVFSLKKLPGVERSSGERLIQNLEHPEFEMLKQLEEEPHRLPPHWRDKEFSITKDEAQIEELGWRGAIEVGIPSKNVPGIRTLPASFTFYRYTHEVKNVTVQLRTKSILAGKIKMLNRLPWDDDGFLLADAIVEFSFRRLLVSEKGKITLNEHMLGPAFYSIANMGFLRFVKNGRRELNSILQISHGVELLPNTVAFYLDAMRHTGLKIPHNKIKMFDFKKLLIDWFKTSAEYHELSRVITTDLNRDFRLIADLDIHRSWYQDYLAPDMTRPIQGKSVPNVKEAGPGTSTIGSFALMRRVCWVDLQQETWSGWEPYKGRSQVLVPFPGIGIVSKPTCDLYANKPIYHATKGFLTWRVRLANPLIAEVRVSDLQKHKFVELSPYHRENLFYTVIKSHNCLPFGPTLGSPCWHESTLPSSSPRAYLGYYSAEDIPVHRYWKPDQMSKDVEAHAVYKDNGVPGRYFEAESGPLRLTTWW